MYYDYALTVAAGTTKTSPAKKSIRLTKGIIHRVEVEFYPGPRRYVSARIMRGGTQLWPTNPDGAFSTDAYTIAFDEYLELSAEPYTLTFEAWSPNADYSHVITLRIGLLESKIAIMLLSALKGMLKFLNFMGIKV